MLREYDDVEPVILSGELFLAASTFEASVRAFYLVFLVLCFGLFTYVESASVC